MSGRLVPVGGLAAVLAIALILLLAITLRPWANANASYDTHLNFREGVPSSYTRTDVTWMDGTTPYAPPGWVLAPLTPEADRGYALYVAFACSSCHGLDGRGGIVGPPLVGTSPQMIELMVRVGPGGMPAYHSNALPQSDLDAIVSYIMTQSAQQPAAPDIPHPADRQTPCVQCHGSGVATAPQMPDDHVGRTNNACQSCHGAGAPAEATPTPSVATPTTPSTTAVPKDKASYSRDIEPIFKRSCAACHGAAALGGLKMTSYQTLMTTGSHGPVIVPGSSRESLLYQTLVGEGGVVPRMPPGLPLSQQEIEAIARWIDQGAAED